VSAGAFVLDEITDRARWNAFVSASPHGHFFQSWEWGLLQDGLGGAPTRVAALEGDTIVGAVQLLRFAGERTFTYVPRGPVVDPAREEVADALVEAVLAISAAAGAFLVRLEPQWTFDPALADRLASRGFTVSARRIMPPRTLLVDLRPPVDDIWAAFRSTTRNRVRLAQKRGVGVRVGRGTDVESFVRLFEETNARHGLRLGRPEQFRLADRHFGSQDTMRLFLASADDVDLAGIMVFLWGATATYLWGASSASESARQLNPNQLLHWTAMQWARERGCASYDLFGIPDYDADVLEAEYGQRTGGWWNLYRFKRGFGGTVHRHLGTFDRRLPPARPG
jgi:lipid II:glycine glycyltransferase (peptidoglycan interpeptide bridge formation enzyme)